MLTISSKERVNCTQVELIHEGERDTKYLICKQVAVALKTEQVK